MRVYNNRDSVSNERAENCSNRKRKNCSIIVVEKRSDKLGKTTSLLLKITGQKKCLLISSTLLAVKTRKKSEGKELFFRLLELAGAPSSAAALTSHRKKKMFLGLSSI